MGMTRKHFTWLMLLALLAIGNAPVIAQETESDAPESAIVESPENVKRAETAAAGTPQTAPEPVFSPVGADAVTLAASSELITQSADTVMTFGTCSVIDDFVRQFCAANPGDISCQFQ
jgi:hypothetical protein